MFINPGSRWCRIRGADDKRDELPPTVTVLPLRYISGLTQIGGEALHSFRAAVSRADFSLSPNSWKVDDFWTNYGWLVTTSVAMILCYLWAIPNAGMFLLIAVVHSVFAGGFRTGLASASLSSLYTAIYLSNPEQLFHYNPENLRGLLGLGTACYGTVFLLMYLRRRDVKTAEEAAERIRSADIKEDSEQQFRGVADAAPVLLWMADTRGRRYFFNQPWLRFTGRTLEQQVGRVG